jgi:single-stranded DNA-binding protein
MRLAIGTRDTDATVFIDVVAFGRLTAELEMLTKGQRVMVCGRLDQRKWLAEDGSRRSVHQIIARRIEALEPPRWEPVASSGQARSTHSGGGRHGFYRDRTAPRDAVSRATMTSSGASDVDPFRASTKRAAE